MHQAVKATLDLARAATKSGHKLNGVVQPPSKWADAAGFSGSSASAVRQHIARQSGNGCGRKGRYPAVDAQGMVNLILYGVQYSEADTKPKAEVAAKRTRTLLSKARGASAKSATTAKTTRKRQVKSGGTGERKAKATPKVAA